ncbi:S1C family serine protease [Limnoglobus roseus]|uniref:Serine protease n=1 Tax=Limnoglobus roseus TaxID=2598579 RepID=A0A5C1AKZ0_9BACT|nr:trypsin-like peptidase domain-containing protein [Limnoglobus roseus]QEL20059.1 serine protease [Limnoglobus roseus]
MSFRRFALALLLSPLFAISIPAADTKKVVWDPTRTTAPDTVEEVKALQDTVKDLVEKVTPATVALILGEVDPSKPGPQSVGAGSGVIVSADGLVLTAAHVVEPPVFGFGVPGQRRERDRKPPVLRLRLPGNIEVKGKILGTNARLDSGMVKIDEPVPEGATWPGAKEGKWPFVEIGDSTKVHKGQWVVSLGHPGGPKPDRRAPVRLGQIVEAGDGAKILRSDCTLVGGDSGGPLFDLTGKLVGIHSRIGEKLDDNIHVAAKAYQDEWKRLVRGDVIGRDATAVMGVILSREKSKQPRIDDFPPDSPAEKAGLKKGDLIVKLNGQAVPTSEDFDDMMAQLRPNDVATVEVQRGDETLEAKVTLARVRRRAAN